MNIRLPQIEKGWLATLDPGGSSTFAEREALRGLTETLHSLYAEIAKLRAAAKGHEWRRKHRRPGDSFEFPRWDRGDPRSAPIVELPFGPAVGRCYLGCVKAIAGDSVLVIAPYPGNWGILLLPVWINLTGRTMPGLGSRDALVLVCPD